MITVEDESNDEYDSELAHDMGNCSMWCERCYVESCEQYDTVSRLERVMVD